MANDISSEAKKNGLVPFRDPEKMTVDELQKLKALFDPNSMGFDGTEGVNEACTK